MIGRIHCESLAFICEAAQGGNRAVAVGSCVAEAIDAHVELVQQGSWDQA